MIYVTTSISLSQVTSLIIYGDAYFEKGVGGNLYNISGHKNKALFYTYSKDLYFGGVHISELKKLIDEEKTINVLVLAAKTDPNDKDPGPIINSLVTNEITNLRVPVMIVPGNFSIEHIAQIT